jgi:hypothetical protein
MRIIIWETGQARSCLGDANRAGDPQPRQRGVVNDKPSAPSTTPQRYVISDDAPSARRRMRALGRETTPGSRWATTVTLLAMIRAVVFDVGECLVNENREYGTWVASCQQGRAPHRPHQARAMGDDPAGRPRRPASNLTHRVSGGSASSDLGSQRASALSVLRQS